MLHLLLLFCLFFNGSLHPKGIDRNTLIKTVDGHCLVKDIQERDTVFSYDFKNGSIAQEEVLFVFKKIKQFYIKITIESEEINVSSEVLFYLPLEKRWKAACFLTTKDILLQFSGKFIGINSIEKINEPIELVTLSTSDHHNFFISSHEICVHNFDIGIALGWLFGGGLEFSGAKIASTIAGTAIGASLKRASQNNQERYVPGLDLNGSWSSNNAQNQNRPYNRHEQQEFNEIQRILRATGPHCMPSSCSLPGIIAPSENYNIHNPYVASEQGFMYGFKGGPTIPFDPLGFYNVGNNNVPPVVKPPVKIYTPCAGGGGEPPDGPNNRNNNNGSNNGYKPLCDPPDRCSRNERMTSRQACEAAKELGYEKTNYYSKDQPVFKKGNRYISPDETGHNGGVWKMARTVEELRDRTTRMGTYDKSLNRIGD